MATPVTLIPGDGIGPEIVGAVCRIVDATGAPIKWEPVQAGASVFTAGDPSGVPEETIASLRATGIALKGPLETPVGQGFRSVNVALRKSFDLYANVRPARTIVPGRYDDVDIVLVDARAATSLWAADVASDSSATLSPALAASVAGHLADLVAVAP